LDIKPGLRTVYTNICAKYSYQLDTVAHKNCITEWSHQFDEKMPGFQGHSGIQCTMKKCFLLPHLLEEMVKTMQTDNPKDNITILITIFFLNNQQYVLII